MIDYFLKFASEAAAKTVLAQYLTPDGGWPTDYCLPGVQVWRQSQDTVDGDGNVVHQYLAGWFMIVSLGGIVPALRDSAPVQLVVHRELAVPPRQPGALIKSNVSLAVLQDIAFSPVYAGMDTAYATYT